VELKLDQVLGEGAYGTVYKGRWKSSEVAIKKLKVQKFSDGALEEFRREAEIMFQLGNESDHIVRLKKICLESPNYSLVMELMPKGSLYEVLHNNQDLPWPVRYQIALDIAHGLDTLHGYNILHRDLKSLNVLLGAGMRAKLSDFGLSKIKQETSSQSSHPAKGTPQWMAPELFDDEPQVTKASDIYSLGVVYWELVTRAIPFAKAPNQQVVLGWVMRGKKETIPEDCPGLLKTLINDCWQAPVKRPAIGKVVERLTPLLESKEPVAEPVQPLAAESLATPMSLLSVGSEAPAPYAAGVDSAAARRRQAADDLQRQQQIQRLQAENEELKKQQAERARREEAAQRQQQEMEQLKAENEKLKRQQSELAWQEEAKRNQKKQYHQPAASAAQNPFAILPSPKPALKPVDAKELEKLLKWVVEGEQEQAEALIEKNPQLLLASGQVTDLSGRTFKNITAFQYALWAMDYHIWTMIKNNLPLEEQVKQFNALESKGTEHGKQYDIKPLTEALQTYVDNAAGWNYDQRAEDQWCKKVGGAQRLVPAHVANEYARPDRAFEPCPSEWESKLPRTREMEVYDGSKWVKGSWFVAPSAQISLGSNFAFLRYNFRGRAVACGGVEGSADGAAADLKALHSLWKARTQQRELLKSELTSAVGQIHRLGAR